MYSRLRAALPVLAAMKLADIKSGALRTLADSLVDQGYKPRSVESIIKLSKMVVESDVDENGEPKHLRKWNNDHILENVAAPARVKLQITATTIETAIQQLESPDEPWPG